MHEKLKSAKVEEAVKVQKRTDEVLEVAWLQMQWDRTAEENAKLEAENEALQRQIRCIDLRIKQFEKESGRVYAKVGRVYSFSEKLVVSLAIGVPLAFWVIAGIRHFIN